jgi:4-hydroxy-4-methyl-2-oxoglutarate aldolase
MKIRIYLIVAFINIFLTYSQSPNTDKLKSGVRFIETAVYSSQEDSEILSLYQGLRVADVSDGMDMVGLGNTGLVDASIHAAWKDPDSLKHQFHGIALTVRYVPSNLPDQPDKLKDFKEWEGNFYYRYSSEPFTSIIKAGHVIVIDDVEEGDIGTIGSCNILSWYQKGAVGVITDAKARDTDEIAKEFVPLYFRGTGRGIRPGRNMIESVNLPVSIGGVLVSPGDIVVADGDGVVVVPRRVAKQVALYAREILEKDKESRLHLYRSLGLPLDQTVK